MSLEQLKAFLAKAKDDQSIQAKLEGAKSPEDVVTIAKDYGHDFTADKCISLTEMELEGTYAGGTPLKDMCTCMATWNWGRYA